MPIRCFKNEKVNTGVCGHTRMHKIRNQNIQQAVEKVLSQVLGRHKEAQVHKSDVIPLEQVRRQK